MSVILRKSIKKSYLEEKNEFSYEKEIKMVKLLLH